MRAVRKPLLLGAAIGLLVGACAAVLLGRFSAAVFCGVMAASALVGAFPRRPRADFVQLRDVLLPSLVVDGFIAFLIVDVWKLVAGGEVLSHEMGMDLPMLAIAIPFGILATRATCVVARGGRVPYPRPQR